MLTRWWHYVLLGLASMFLAAVLAVAVAAALIYPSLPSLHALTDYRPKMPLRIYSAGGHLMAEFGEERRTVVQLQDTPLILREAILAAEDERFYEHGGVDTMGVMRAILANIFAGGVREGASTITMQVARNFFLSSERTFRRKLNEALLAIKIEHTLTKDQIFQLYINQIYLGQRAYGFAAAARTYFGTPIEKIDLAEAAMLAGLPKGPSVYNPVVNPDRARIRQMYVLGRMLRLKFITKAQYEEAKNERLHIRHSDQVYDSIASYVDEMARRYVYNKYGGQVYISGMKVYTTIHLDEQEAAQNAVRAGVVAFERRRGYRGPEAQIKLPPKREVTKRNKVIEKALRRDDVNGLVPAVVMAISSNHILLRMRGGKTIKLGRSEVKFAARAMSARTPVRRRFRVGSVVRVVRLGPDQPWQLAYLPSVEAALVALDPDTGAITALVGGFDYSRNQFNHVTQAWRQPGSSFKPFIYSAALERGITPATVYDDGPIDIPPEQTGGQEWEPKNYDNEREGPITVRTALAHSNNLASIRLLEDTGPRFAQAYVLKFGFTADRIPPYMTMALGAGEVTPMQLARAYAVFASGGSLPQPYFLTEITDQDGKVLETFKPNPPQPVIDPRNAFIMTSLMQSVVRRGTAEAALKLGRTDLAGKTGTTNDQRDAWFAGYDPQRVAVAWVGYDQPKPLGHGETGARAALPIWMDYMSEALKGVPDNPYPMPKGVVVMDVDPKTGVPVAEGGQPEYFLQEFLPWATGTNVAIPGTQPPALPSASTFAVKPGNATATGPANAPASKPKSWHLVLPGTRQEETPGAP